MDEQKSENKEKVFKLKLAKPNKKTGLELTASYTSGQTKPSLGPPDWLNEQQKTAWESAIKFAPPNQLHPIDASVLIVWVVALDLFRQAAIQLSKESLVITSPRTQRQVPNPLVGIIAKQSAIVLRAAAELGFSPSSRSRLRCGSGDQSESEWDDF
jgi:P27 family predicted phage terminase small subunit